MVMISPDDGTGLFVRFGACSPLPGLLMPMESLLSPLQAMLKLYSKSVDSSGQMTVEAWWF